MYLAYLDLIFKPLQGGLGNPSFSGKAEVLNTARGTTEACKGFVCFSLGYFRFGLVFEGVGCVLLGLESFAWDFVCYFGLGFFVEKRGTGSSLSEDLYKRLMTGVKSMYQSVISSYKIY